MSPAEMEVPDRPNSVTPVVVAPRPRNDRALILAAAVLASLLGFGWTLDGYFVGDDFGYVSRFFELPWRKWPSLFVQSWAGDMWGFQLRELRPVTALSFMVEARLWGGNALGFRLTNLVLHAGCAAMVGILAWRAARRDLVCGIAAAALFALHPAHAEPVHWITGRVDVLATTFYLAGFLAFLRYRARGGWWLAVVGAIYGAAAFSKEFGLTLPVMFIFADAVWGETRGRWREWRTWAPYVVSVGVVVVYFFCRRAAFGGGGMGAALPALGNADFQLQFSQRQLTYISHLFPPVDRWLREGSPLIGQNAIRTLGWIAGSAALIFALWGWGAKWRPAGERRTVVFFGWGWYLVATLPLVVTYVSPRHLYLASAGVCVAFALLARGLLRVRVIYAVAMIAVLALFVPRLSFTMKPWHRTAILSGMATKEIRRLEPEVQPGSAVLFDVPEIIEGAYVWTWAIPFVVRPPFTRQPLDQLAVVLGSRGAYVFPHLWEKQPAIAALARVEKESWIIQISERAPPRRIAVPAAKLRAAAERFAAAPLVEFPHQSWRKFIDELAAP